jgi:hypothetical protein
MSTVNKSWFIGYKLHGVIFDNGVVQQSGITKRNVHGINFLKQVKNLPENRKILGDIAYISKTLQMDLFKQYKVKMLYLSTINYLPANNKISCILYGL